LFQQYLRQERRDEIYANFAVAQAEQQNGEVTVSSDTNELKQLIED
jgi:hypothetical protein